MTAWLSTAQNRVLALWLACDMLKNLQDKSEAAWPIFMPAIFEALGQGQDEDLRIAACYAINLASGLERFSEALSVVETEGSSNFQSEVGEAFGEIGGELPAKFGRRFSSFFCWGKKSSEAFSTKTPPQISPSNLTTRFWVVAGPRNGRQLQAQKEETIHLIQKRLKRAFSPFCKETQQ